MPTTILLIRHGQTEWNRVERFRGRADVPLNETGFRQAEATGCHVAALWQPVALYSSPLSRAVRTAQAIGLPLQLKTSFRPGLIDIDYGEWQGLTPDEVQAKWPEMVETWYTRPQLAQIPQGETLEAVRERAMETLTDLVSLHPDQTVLVVSHTAINRLILLGAMGIGLDRFWKIRQEPCAINVLEVTGDEYTLVSWNQTDHLRLVQE